MGWLPEPETWEGPFRVPRGGQCHAWALRLRIPGCKVTFARDSVTYLLMFPLSARVIAVGLSRINGPICGTIRAEFLFSSTALSWRTAGRI